MNLASLRKRPFRFRFAQSRAPLVVTPAHGEPYRPTVAILLNETQQTVVGMEAIEKPLSLGEAREWILRTLINPAKSAGPPCKPNVLLVDDETLQQSLRFTFRATGVEVQVDKDYTQVRAVLRRMESEMSSNVSPCLVDTLGTEKAAELFKAALTFHQQAPWNAIDSDTVMALVTPASQKPMSLVVMGSHGEQFGLTLYDSVETGRSQVAGGPTRFTAALNFSPDAYLRLSDLDLLEDVGLSFPAQRLPWVLGDLKKGGEITAQDTDHLIWALRNLDEFLASRQPLSKDGYLLLLPEQQDQHAALLEFAQPWLKKGKLSAKGEDVALYCLRFLEYLEEHESASPAELSTHRANSQTIGGLLLKDAPRKAFDARLFFVDPPEQLPPQCAETWKAMGDFYRYLLEDYEPHPGASAKHLTEVCLKVFNALVGVYDSPDKKVTPESTSQLREASETLDELLRNLNDAERDRATQALLDLALHLEGTFNRQLSESQLPPLSPRILEEFGQLVMAD